MEEEQRQSGAAMRDAPGDSAEQAAGAVPAPEARDAEAGIKAGTEKAELEELRAWKAARLEADALAARREAVAKRLREAGAVPEAVPLLVLSVEKDTAGDPGHVAQTIRERYPGFFRREERVPTPGVPRTENGLWTADRDSLAAMSAGEINRRWSEVKAALKAL